MFDGRWRHSFEEGLKPVGANLRRTGITADHLTALGVGMAAAASIAIANGALRAGLLLLVLCALPDVLDGAVAKASGTAGPRGAFFDSVSDRVTDALLLGGVAWHLSTTHPGRIAVLPLAVLAASMLISYERAKAESLGFDARGGLMERAERIIALGVGLLFDSVLDRRPLVHAGAHPVHGGPAVREGVAAGVGHEAGSDDEPLEGSAGRPSHRARVEPAPAREPPVGPPPVGVDLITPGYKTAAAVARALPHPVAASGARVLGRLAGRIATERRAQVERNLRRVDPTLSGARLRRLVDETFESYRGTTRSRSGCPAPAPPISTRGSAPTVSSTSTPRWWPGAERSWRCPTSAAGSGRGSG